MKITTAFNAGDKGWVFDGSHVRQRTIGQIAAIYTSSAGIGDGFMEGGVIVNHGENYAPMAPTMVEKYMCVETGIGSGTVYTLGESIFVTEEECRSACAEDIARRAKEVADRKAYERNEKLRQESYLRIQLAEIERLKLEAA